MATMVGLSALALSLIACEEDKGSSGSGYGYAACRQYDSCETCTPVAGCGWCYKDDGTGMCADDPNDCAAATAFRWTWEPTGCRVTADAGVNAIDAASESGS
jgi:hypothetical protein